MQQLILIAKHIFIYIYIYIDYKLTLQDFICKVSDTCVIDYIFYLLGEYTV